MGKYCRKLRTNRRFVRQLLGQNYTCRRSRWAPAAKNLYGFVRSARTALAHWLRRHGVWTTYDLAKDHTYRELMHATSVHSYSSLRSSLLRKLSLRKLASRKPDLKERKLVSKKLALRKLDLRKLASRKLASKKLALKKLALRNLGSRNLTRSKESYLASRKLCLKEW